MNEFFEYFAGSGFTITMTVLVMAVIFVFIVMLMYVPTLSKRILPRFGYAKYADYLPFKTVYNDNTIELTDGAIIKAYRVQGV
ncbi:MAG: hypothetical protein II219_01950, partial [Alphaproteobacteria bacterium]|nr:hypothetical protein [Alphaproteobacteria bacterium]